MIETIFIVIRAWLHSLRNRDCRPDPLSGLGLRELADLPVYHPRCND